MIKFLLTFLASITLFLNVSAQTKYEKELAANVSEAGLVNYKSWKTSHEGLDKFLEHAKTENPDKLSKTEQKAFYINVYNAATIKLIIDNYPVKSINDINKPWDSKIVDIAGKDKLTLNELENDILRKEWNDPRIHFAINCAALSCPKLSYKMYKASSLDKQLDASTKYFLKDSSKNIIDDGKWLVSKVFDWFSVDFDVKGGSLNFIDAYVDADKPKKLNFLEYNWALNKQ